MHKVLVHTAIDTSGGAGLTAASEAIRAIGVDVYVVPSGVTGQRVINKEIEARINFNKPFILRLVELNAPYDVAFLGFSVITPEEAMAERVVVDPVIYTSHGARIDDPAHLLNVIEGAYVITPNLREASELAGSKDIGYILEALAEYSERVIVTGVNGEDIIRTPHGRVITIKPRTPAVGYRDLRGSGTLYSATIAGLLAKGMNVPDAAREAKRLVEMSAALSVYTGSKKADTEIYLRRHLIEKEHYESLKSAVEEVVKIKELPKLLPEVGSNFAYALPRAHDERDVFGITGRIVRSKLPPRANVVGEIKLGGSSHIGRAIVAMMKHYPELRSCMNIKYSKKLIEALEENYVVTFYDRREEPPEIKSVEGRTTQWGIDQAVVRAKKKYGDVPPDIVYHMGDRGKEPMILVFGRDPEEVYKKVRDISVRLTLLSDL